MKTGRVKTVIFDWAGTTVDYGCFAPLKVFLEIFRRRGIEVTIAEARGPMGRMKRDHIRAMCETPRIRDLWISKYGAEPSEADIDSLYSDFEPALLDILPDYCEPIPEVLETVEEIRAKGISIGSTTGYTSKMMDIVIPGAKARGYLPDFVVDSSMVPAGRPYPYMIWRNCIELQSPNLAEVVKVGDTIADIKEGRNAGVWSVGVLRGSSLVGLSRGETANMPDFELVSLLASAERRYLSAGAHYVANSIEDVLWIIDDIERRLSLGDTPSAPANEYKLFTPGPLTTSPTVKSRMLTDWGSRNRDYLELVEDVRRRLVKLASKTPKDFTTALIQGSGTFAVEALIGTAIPADGKLLILVNGAYGERMAKIAERLGIAHDTLVCDEMAVHDLREVEEKLSEDSAVTHVAVVHCETTTGIINPVAEIGAVVKSHGAVFIVDAMSSFGGVPMDMDEMGADYLVSSANKCIQGVPGFGFAIARLAEFEKCGGRARSLSLDLFDNWKRMEEKPGSWRFTSPVHVVRAFHQALVELEMEGGVSARFARYSQNQRILAEGMARLGFEIIDFGELQSPIISTFKSPSSPDYDFARFYDELAMRGFVIYPGKTTKSDTFRIGTIGELYSGDIQRLLRAVEEVKFW